MNYSVTSIFLFPTRHPPYLGGPSSTCRSKSYHQGAYIPPARYPENIHTDPLYRKTIRPIHPAEAAGIITAQSYVSRRPPSTRYVIVNEHEARKKLLRSATRIPRHFRMEDPGEILELYPRNVKRYTPRTPHHPHGHRAHPSQPHLSEEEEEEEEEAGKSVRRGALGQTLRPHSLSDLHQPTRFYIGERADSQLSMAKDSLSSRGRSSTQQQEEGVEGDWEDVGSRSGSQINVRGAEVLPAVVRRHTQSPGKRAQTSPHIQPPVKPKTSRTKLEPSLTESDSASLASSSDQQNSSTDQYIQVIHNKERYLKSETRHVKMVKKKSKASIDLNVSASKDLMCSNV